MISLRSILQVLLCVLDLLQMNHFYWPGPQGQKQKNVWRKTRMCSRLSWQILVDHPAEGRVAKEIRRTSLGRDAERMNTGIRFFDR